MNVNCTPIRDETSVRRLRVGLAMSCRAFADELGVSASLVAAWDRGAAPLSARMALRIADTWPDALEQHVGSVESLLRGNR